MCVTNKKSKNYKNIYGMKKILSVLVVVLFFTNVNAQELSDALKAKNAGNGAYKSKNYVTAIQNWDKYLTSGEEGAAADQNTKSLRDKAYKLAGENFFKGKDYKNAYKYYDTYTQKVEKEVSVVYKMAYCATKMKDNTLAISKYKECVDLGYNEDKCMMYMANIYKKTGDEANMTATLKEAIAKYPDSKYKSKMAGMLATPVLKEAAVPFSKANELAKAAAEGDPNEYVANMAKATAKFEEAIPQFKKVLELDPSNEQAATYLKACEDNIKSFEDYKANLKK